MGVFYSMGPMSNQYQNNHYVPAWYQKRFVPVGQKDQELYYLDFKPGFFVDSRGVTHLWRAGGKVSGSASQKRISTRHGSALRNRRASKSIFLGRSTTLAAEPYTS